MKVLENFGYEYGRVPTGYCYSKVDKKGKTIILYEDKKISIHPPKGKTEAGNEYCFTEFAIDELQAVVDKAKELWRC